MTDVGAMPEEAPTPEPPLTVRTGTVRIDDLDTFLASVREVSAETGAGVQTFDADLVVSEDALRLATRLAARAIARDEAVARDPAVEILLYVAGCRQIERALRFGVSEGRTRATVVIADFGDVPGAERPTADLDAAATRVEEWFEGGAGSDRNGTDRSFDTAAIRDWYGVTDRELDATAGDLVAVVHERIALLDVEK